MAYLAVPLQTYREHVNKVRAAALRNADAATRYNRKDGKALF